MNILAIMDGTQRNFAEGVIVCLTAILIVFTVLLIIIGASSLVSTLINKLNKKTNSPVKKTSKDEITNTVKVNVDDEDMMAAILVATIDYRNEINEDVKVISVKEVK